MYHIRPSLESSSNVGIEHRTCRPGSKLDLLTSSVRRDVTERYAVFVL